MPLRGVAAADPSGRLQGSTAGAHPSGVLRPQSAGSECRDGDRPGRFLGSQSGGWQHWLSPARRGCQGGKHVSVGPQHFFIFPERIFPLVPLLT